MTKQKRTRGYFYSIGNQYRKMLSSSSLSISRFLLKFEGRETNYNTHTVPIPFKGKNIYIYKSNKQETTKEKQYSLDIYTTPLQEEERSETQENRSGQTHRNILHIQIAPKSYLEERVRLLRHPTNKLLVHIDYMMFVPVSMRPIPKNRMLRKPKS